MPDNIKVEDKMKPEPFLYEKKEQIKQRRRNVPRPIVLNESGQRLNKDGTVDKRQFQGTKNLQKSKIFQDIVTVKKDRLAKVKELANALESDSESEEDIIADEEEDEYELEELVVKRKGEPQVVEVEVIKEVVREDPVKAVKLEKLEKVNRTLKQQFDHIEHLNRIDMMNRSIGIKR